MKKDKRLTYKKLRHPKIGNIRVYQVSEHASLAAAQFISDIAKDNPVAAITYATGETMIPVYRALATMVNRGEVDFSETKAFHLDEYYPCSPDSPHSFARYIRERVFEALGISEENRFLINGLAEDPEAEAQRYNSLLKKEKIDLAILGIGPGSHIGFNEQGTPFDKETHLANLSQETIDRDKIERGQNTPEHAITQGISNILSARKILLLGYGSKKGTYLNSALTESITPDIPASALRLVGDKVSVFIDNEAARSLNIGFFAV
jgi:glucosamine-6-phosphate deaminase